jgi:putative ABC transport system substrate-binding protein
MRRRNFISLVGGAAAWPIAARGQQPKMPVIGYLGLASAAVMVPRAAGFKQGLSEIGYVEGQNVCGRAR